MQRSNNHSHIKSSSNPRALRSDSPLSLSNTKKKTLPLHRQGRALPASMALRTRLRYARPHGQQVVQHRPAQLSLLTNLISLTLCFSSQVQLRIHSNYPVALLMGTGTAATPSLPAARGPFRSPDPVAQRLLPRQLPAAATMALRQKRLTGSMTSRRMCVENLLFYQLIEADVVIRSPSL
jgi:hypothetical protein